MTPPFFPSISLLSSINMTSPTSVPSSQDIIKEQKFNHQSTSSTTYSNHSSILATTAVKKRSLTMVESFTTSGLGGMFGWALIHPCNTVAVRMNLTPKGQVFSLSKMISEHGVLSLYAGIEAGLLRQLFYASSRFGLFEIFRDIAHDIRGKTDFASRVGIGAITGGMAAYISCPMEVCVVRMANDSSLPIDQRRYYTSVIDVATRIVKEEGVMAFWRGSNPFVTRAMMVGVFQVATLDQFQSIFTKYLHVGKESIENVFCSAMSAGLIYSIATMPLEACKNRMASQKVDPVTKQLPYKSIIQTLSKVSAEEGFLALFNGFVPYYLRCGGHTVAMFIIIKLLRDSILE